MKHLINTALILLGLKSEPVPSNCRLIYLRDGRKVIAPAKPEKIRVSYSIVPETRLDFPNWFQYIMLRGAKETPEQKTIRKWYLEAGK